jgi:hypothetical protein
MKLKLLVLGIGLLNVHFLSAQDLSFPPKVNFFQYSLSVSGRPLYGFPNARIWGWSNNGKVAYSIETEVEGRGGQKIDFVVLDLISDDIEYELKMDSFDHNDVTDEALYNLFRTDISNALKKYNISGQRTEFLRFPIRKNDMVYDSRIINVEQKKNDYAFDTVVSKYAVSVTANGESKTIGTFIPVNTITAHVYVCGYVLSPFENRALVVAAEEHWGFEGTELTYRFSGCHLGVGFN